MPPPLKLKSKGVVIHQVQEGDLATNWRNDVPVLATPVLLWLAELACMRAIGESLEPGKMTLGYAHDMRHMSPTPVGWKISIEAELVKNEGGKLLTFEVEARDGEDVILSGSHTRAIVDRTRFLDRFESKRNRHEKLC
ncbi:hypothetical protein IG616_07130 [Labrenzia suaedae]|uniref:Fluoroacetyl-CoA-specific thioesterase-like domain-containing protein n=2 Tax=Roseibium litorale TaxID=2803841 RepID=A0ABR9CKQ7_9HYPH|nr:hypothetical protein [Roseibium litorale]